MTRMTLERRLTSDPATRLDVLPVMLMPFG
jgi:hypothetical protein